MRSDDGTAYLTSALIFLTFVLYVGTLLWVVPMIVSLAWTLVLVTALISLHRRRREPRNA